MRPDDKASPGVLSAPTTWVGREAKGDLRVLVKSLNPGTAARCARAAVRQVLEEAGINDDEIDDVELVVAELAANCEKHARPPYELRIFGLVGVPAWCEIVDGDGDLRDLSERLDRPCPAFMGDMNDAVDLTVITESGRGLPMVHRLARGCCCVYPTRTLLKDVPGKAVAFALPAAAGACVAFPYFLNLGPDLVNLRWAGLDVEALSGEGDGQWAIR